MGGDRLDAELYLSEVIRILPYWPRDRYLELAPKYLLATRARLSAEELARPLGPITVPTATLEWGELDDRGVLRPSRGDARSPRRPARR